MNWTCLLVQDLESTIDIAFSLLGWKICIWEITENVKKSSAGFVQIFSLKNVRELLFEGWELCYLTSYSPKHFISQTTSWIIQSKASSSSSSLFTLKMKNYLDKLSAAIVARVEWKYRIQESSENSIWSWKRLKWNYIHLNTGTRCLRFQNFPKMRLTINKP